MARREYEGAAKPTQLDADISVSATSMTIRNSSGWPTGATGSFAAVINRGKADEEKVLCSLRTDTTLTISTRGYDDTSASAHSQGATVEHCATAIDLDEANDHINDTTNDHHTQYLNTTRHDAHDHSTALSTAAFSDLGTKTHTHQDAAGGGTLDHGLALTGLTDDDHTQYLLANGTRALNGPLDHDGATVGFYGVTPAARPAAITQTYSTADRTVAAPTAAAPAAMTAADLTDNTAGTADTTLQALADGTTYANDVAAIRNNFADLAAMVDKLTVDLTAVRAEVVKLVADVAADKKNLNAIIDDLQSLGLEQ